MALSISVHGSPSLSCSPSPLLFLFSHSLSVCLPVCLFCQWGGQGPNHPGGPALSLLFVPPVMMFLSSVIASTGTEAVKDLVRD